MIDEELDRLLRGEVPREDADARERARARLRFAISRDRRRRRARRLGALAAALSAFAVTLVTLQVFLASGSAIAEIRRLGELASEQDEELLRPDQFIYRHYQESTLQVTGSVDGSEFYVSVRTDVELWLAADGSGERVTTIRSVEFPSELDRRLWTEAGQPQLPSIARPRTDRFVPGEWPPIRVEDLPSEPEALRTAITGRKIIETGTGDNGILSSIGVLLTQGNLRPELRQALFEVAASLESVYVQTDTQDPLGRAAVAVIASGLSGGTTLYFDPGDARFLGSTDFTPAYEGHRASTTWTAYLSVGVVDEVGDRPVAELPGT